MFWSFFTHRAALPRPPSFCLICRAPPRFFWNTGTNLVFPDSFQLLTLVPSSNFSGTRPEQGLKTLAKSKPYVVPRGYFALFLRHIVGAVSAASQGLARSGLVVSGPHCAASSGAVDRVVSGRRGLAWRGSVRTWRGLVVSGPVMHTSSFARAAPG